MNLDKTDEARTELNRSQNSFDSQEDGSTNKARDSAIEKSFEVITDSMDHAIDGLEAGDQQGGGPNESRKNSRSDSVTINSSISSRLKKSAGILSKLQASAEESDVANLPSSIANAFSSISSFTSGFSLNSSTANTNMNENYLTIDASSTSTRSSQANETREDIFLRKAGVERRNLINLTQLIVKDLISSSLLAGRTIDESNNAIHLNNYFTLVDRVLKHGLKQNILSNRSSSLWSALENLSKCLKESTFMSESVRSLSNTKTVDGKIKAWMRLAMMQKKMPEYFNELLSNREVVLKDIYHDYAFMMNDEAHVFAGLIIGINVIDCNFFVKDANFDLMDDVIDLKPYLRVATNLDEEQAEDQNTESNSEESELAASVKSLKLVLDQKNYLEERNKRLESTIADMNRKIKIVEDQNSRLEMEVKLNEVRINKLQDKTNLPPIDKLSLNLNTPMSDVFKNLVNPKATVSSKPKLTDSTISAGNEDRQDLQQSTENESTTINENQPVVDLDNSGIQTVQSTCPSSSETTPASQRQDTQKLGSDLEDDQLLHIEKLQLELAHLKERSSILETSYRDSLEKIKLMERDLDVHTSMNADKETTIKIFEKDIKEKQAQVESLRASLNDSKKLNSDLSERLNETSIKLKDRVKMVSTLQAALDKWKLENKTLATRLQEAQMSLDSTKSELEKALNSIKELKKYNEKINDDLKMERETGQSSTETLEAQNARISELSERLAQFESELKDIKPYKDRCDQLARRCQEYELSLEEVGAQLRESRLEVENLKENSAVFLDSQWMDSKQVKVCALCDQTFSVTRRKHHCRLCGNVFCQNCSDNKMELASSSKPVRVCDTCHSFLLAKFIKQSSTS